MRLFLIQCFLHLLFIGQMFAEDEKYLSNVTQITFSSMGFEKAGEAYFSPDGKKIIFQAVPKGESHYQMYVMDLKDGIPKMVSTGKGACTCGFFHPDGQKILFASSHEDPNPSEPVKIPGKYKWDLTPYMNIYEANVDGTALKPLTSGPAYHAECAYSPDGTEIVFASNEEGCMNLYVMNSDGTNSRKITSNSSCYNGGPFFSPDGKQIIFRADRDEPDYLQIYLIDSDGSNEKQLTENHVVNWAPYWYPNGKVVAFTTSLHGHYRYEIYLLNIDTMIQTRLTYNPSFDGLPAFNKEGTKIMWTSQRSEDKSCQIFMADFTLPLELN